MNWDWHAAAGGFWEEVGVGALGMDDFVVVVGQVPLLNLTSQAVAVGRFRHLPRVFLRDST